VFSTILFAWLLFCCLWIEMGRLSSLFSIKMIKFNYVLKQEDRNKENINKIKRRSIMKNIIVPVDFSEESVGGLQIALLFAKRIPVTVQLVYVMQKVSEQGHVSVDAENDFAEKQLKAMVDKYNPMLGKDSKLQYFIKKGRIFQEIVNQAQSYPDSIITASTHGASGFQEFFIGSNAYRILSATDKPVITIRTGNCPVTIGKIVLPVDTTIDSRQKVPFTIDIAKIFDAEIHVVGIPHLHRPGGRIHPGQDPRGHQRNMGHQCSRNGSKLCTIREGRSDLDHNGKDFRYRTDHRKYGSPGTEQSGYTGTEPESEKP
jgi:nucleotide-binding universal stress UspA family protein